MDKSKYKHLKSVIHKIIDKSVTRRYFIQNPNSNEIDEILRKYINIYNKKHQRDSVINDFKASNYHKSFLKEQKMKR